MFVLEGEEFVGRVRGGKIRRKKEIECSFQIAISTAFLKIDFEL